MKDKLYIYTLLNPTTGEARVFQPANGAVICEDRVYFTQEDTIAAINLAKSQGFTRLAVTEA